MSELSRRELLFGVAAGSVAVESSLGAQNTERKFRTGPLAGRNLNDLYSEYTGIKGRVPEVVSVDYRGQLDKLWSKKNRRSRNNRVVVETGRQLRNEYKKNGPQVSTIADQVREIQGITDVLHKDLDWAKYANLKKLNPSELETVKMLADSIKGKDLMAYSLTELMPSKDGVLNRQLMDFLLRTAGRNYIESLPAIYDPKTSFGPYQFTEYALFERGTEKRGASIPNSALKGRQIPNSVSKLRGADHHRAGFLFAVDNLANLVNGMNPRQMAVLKQIVNSKHADLVAYIATAHHGPAVAMNIARRWLDNGARAPYEVSCGRVYRLYAEKTKANLRAL